MPTYYPVLLDLTARPCLVIGGGKVAEGKVKGLLAAGARVTVVSPEITPALQHLAEIGQIGWEQRTYREGDLAGAFLAIAATDDRTVTQQVWEEAERRQVLLNAADDPAHCHFILPAVHRQGDLVIAVSTGGKSPALAVQLRDRLAKQFGPEYAWLLDMLAALRQEVAARYPDPETRKQVWDRIMASETLDHVRQGDPERAQHIIRAIWQDLEHEEAQV